MHVRELVELGALLVGHGPLLIRRGHAIAERQVWQYWLASRCRLDRWGRMLQRQRCMPASPAVPSAWERSCPTIEEILASELFTRIWAAICAAHDRSRSANQLEAIARSSLAGHVEARYRALSALMLPPAHGVREAERLNRLRRRIERWTDMLLAHLDCAIDLSDFAFDVGRAGDFRADRQQDLARLTREQTWKLVLAALRAAFRRDLHGPSPNADLNRQIASAVLTCFPPDVFDSTGTLEHIWLLRLDQATGDMQGLVAELLADVA